MLRGLDYLEHARGTIKYPVRNLVKTILKDHIPFEKRNLIVSSGAV